MGGLLESSVRHHQRQQDIFLSNHTLESLGFPSNLPPVLYTLLDLNSSSDDKGEVSIKKIWMHHQHFDMQPFFEWEMKVLPIAVDCFERARSIENACEVGIDTRKLDAIYQFIRGMPEVFVPVPATAGANKRKRCAV